ncbi:MAG: glucose-1-phosphate thymidylyltransferase, partial [Candidatus Methanoperedens sp.]|nr:glucose-1-phosphate thymidylyltransferase [Candidatus Methanoperedens sp.]
NFGAGTKIANLRHDGRTIRVKLKGTLVDSGKRKLGTIMGDDVHTGINSMINIGAVVESGAMISPGKFVK